MRGQGVHTRYTYAVQTSGNLVRTFVELTSGVQYGHNYFQCGFLFLLVIVYRNTTSVVLYGNRIIFVDGHFDVVAITGERFVDRVVHNFINQMVESFDTNVTNIHRGALSYRFQTFQYLDVLGRIVPVFRVNLFFGHNVFS